MQPRYRNTLTATIAIVALTALAGAAIIWPRLVQLRTATTAFGGAELLVVGLLIAIAALAPVAALGRVQTWKPVAVSVSALLLGCALVLSFDQRDGSDGLFIFPLQFGSIVILVSSVVLTLRLRRRGS